MTETPVQRRGAAPKLAVAALVLAAVAVVVVWDPLGSLARSLDLPGSISLPDVPDVPKWLLFLLGKAKFIAIAVIVVLVAANGRRRRNRS